MISIRHFFLDPIRYRSLALAKFRWMQWFHVKTNGGFDRIYRRWCAVIRPPLALPLPQRMNEANISEAIDELRREGCKILPFTLSAAELNELRNFAFSVPAYSKDLSERIFITPDNIPSKSGRYYWPMCDLVKSPAVKSLLSDSTFSSIAQRYLGARPVLAHVSLWLDPVYDGYYDPHIYHFDNDGPGFLKFFFYITDVTATSGAHCFIKGSHDHRKPKKFQASVRYDDGILLKYYGTDQEVMFEAPAGTVIAEDTAGFHRGSTPVNGYRLLMQFEFSLVDIPHEEDLARVTSPILFSGLHGALAKIQRKFYRI